VDSYASMNKNGSPIRGGTCKNGWIQDNGHTQSMVNKEMCESSGLKMDRHESAGIHEIKRKKAWGKKKVCMYLQEGCASPWWGTKLLMENKCWTKQPL
jgi:hypothetical protein